MSRVGPFGIQVWCDGAEWVAHNFELDTEVIGDSLTDVMRRMGCKLREHVRAEREKGRNRG